ncbi:MAG: CbtA family protein [Sporichthyaceae bacterium]
MELKLILRGMFAGLIGGLLAWFFALALAEPVIDAAIEYEGARDEALAKLDGIALEEGAPLVSRTIQGGIGIGVGTVLFAIAMGALVAVAYSLCLGRTGAVRAKPLALLVAAAGFLTVFLIPFAKYPTSPPAASTDDTIHDRGTLFLVVLGVAVLGMVAAVVVGQALKPKFGTWNASVIAGVGYLVGITALFVALPPLGHLGANVAAAGFERSAETPLPIRDDAGNIVFPGFPADVLAEFRAYSVGTHLIVWAGIGLVFAPLAERVLRARPTAQAASLQDSIR